MTKVGKRLLKAAKELRDLARSANAAKTRRQMTDEEWLAQRQSWARGEMAMGLDAQEAKRRAYFRKGEE